MISSSILVINDSDDILNLLTSVLRQASYTVYPVHDWENAQVIIQQQEIALLITDYLHPGVNGLDICRMIKSDDSLSHIKVMLLTCMSSAYFTTLDEVDDYLCGVYTKEDLLAKVQHVLHRKIDTNNKIPEQKPIFQQRKLGGKNIIVMPTSGKKVSVRCRDACHRLIWNKGFR